MMLHSFKEYDHKTKQKKYEKELKIVEETIRNSFSDSEKQAPHWQPLSDFYDIAEEYFIKWSKVRSDILSHPKYQKDMAAGRIVLVRHKSHVNKLGILLSADPKGKKIVSYSGTV
ncbi:hypothetical protein L9F63_026209 [Diploptera punctata]|uniref:Uncharacterized protein n=1 Tax=Diploptera punctata TaxID=6984 RepID=A0AAD8AKB8_DIPPU|nr:hypothetical protein L9F63_026209 [Diploptera punctata]